MDARAITMIMFDVLRGIAPEAAIRALKPDDDVADTLDLDSFDYLRFLIGLHERFGIDIPESQYGRLRTHRALVRYIMEHTSR